MDLWWLSKKSESLISELVGIIEKAVFFPIESYFRPYFRPY